MGTRSKKILEEIHPLSIIREVQKWPVLYVKNSPERANLRFKHKVWTEIAKSLFAEWDCFSAWEQESKVTDLMKKWRNLRDTFRRHLEAEKKAREGRDIKRKTYVYFKHMLYLLPHASPQETSTPDPVVEPRLDEFFNRQNKRKATEEKEKRKIKKRKRLERRLENTSIKSVLIPETHSKCDKEEMIDEDKHFLMSLIPSFKKMSDDEKLEAKVEILKVIKGIRKKADMSADCTLAEDSLSYNLDDTNIGEVKIEATSGDTEFSEQSNISDNSSSSDSGDSDITD